MKQTFFYAASLCILLVGLLSACTSRDIVFTYVKVINLTSGQILLQFYPTQNSTDTAAIYVNVLAGQDILIEKYEPTQDCRVINNQWQCEPLGVSSPMPHQGTNILLDSSQFRYRLNAIFDAQGRKCTTLNDNAWETTKLAKKGRAVAYEKTFKAREGDFQ